MDLSVRLSAAEYCSLAERWRALAAEATTVRTREQLLNKAREYEALASGTGVVARPVGGGS
jgi:hypothetical protein